MHSLFIINNFTIVKLFSNYFQITNYYNVFYFKDILDKHAMMDYVNLITAIIGMVQNVKVRKIYLL
jgi:hypothetical protein